MNKIIKITVSTLALLSCSVFAEVAVIVNKANNDAIDDSMVKKIYLGKAKSFAGGAKIDVFALKGDSAVAEEFIDKALSKSNSQYKSYWSKLIFTGKGTPPEEVDSPEDVISKVKGSAGGIGFIPADKVTDDVKVVAKY